jgi:hypothetical protein
VEPCFASSALEKRLAASEGSMSKAKEEMRAEYRREDFGVLVRGKYAARLKAATNIVVLWPEVARAFPNGDAVNGALMSLINLAKSAARPNRRPGGRAKARS